jgi:hypothetical protein
MTNFENGHLAIWLMNLVKIRLEGRELDENQTWGSWTWWKSDLRIVDLMKIRRWWIEDLIKISHTIIIWVSISQASAGMQENFSSVWSISKTVIWKSESWTWSKWWIGKSWTWWKSDDFDQIIEKASTIGGFWREATHIRAKFII